MHLLLHDDDGVLAVGVGADDDVLLAPLHAQERDVVGVVEGADGGGGDGEERQQRVGPALADLARVLEAGLVQDAAAVRVDDEQAVHAGVARDALERLVYKPLFTFAITSHFLFFLQIDEIQHFFLF